MTVLLSRHAEERLKQRLGLKRKAAKRHAMLAFKDGISPDKYYVKDVAKEYALKQMANKNLMYLFYKDIIHVFGLEEGFPILVTVYNWIGPEKGYEVLVGGKPRNRYDYKGGGG